MGYGGLRLLKTHGPQVAESLAEPGGATSFTTVLSTHLSSQLSRVTLGYGRKNSLISF
ncbi:rCG40976 [Rattus norvegicus]|uniref:RCG40976 n=1 Tax=Rattus norvegicus TaxID=10116 RepID=A6KMR3_RAT|nr:rCG40976 [Rattus norvegicus]